MYLSFGLSQPVGYDLLQTLYSLIIIFYIEHGVVGFGLRLWPAAANAAETGHDLSIPSAFFDHRFATQSWPSSQVPVFSDQGTTTLVTRCVLLRLIIRVRLI